MSHETHELGFIRTYIFSTNHKTIGKQFLFSSLFFLAVGGLLALAIRWQLAFPGQPIPVVGKTVIPSNAGVVDTSTYVMLFTMHGTIMIFFVVIPILVGAFGNFLIPLHVGAHDMAFPVLNMLSYWVFFPAGLLMLGVFFCEGGAAAGWTGYSPLANISEIDGGSKMGMNFWILGMIGVGTTSILGAVNYLTTILKMRAPGLTMWRLPLTTWAQFITSILQLLATPVLASALIMLLIDRLLGTGFFIPERIIVGDQGLVPRGGGQALLWQHLFWFYSHPAVYILVLPAMGIASDLLSVGARKPVFGYKVMVYSMSGIAFLGFTVWAHHMFQSGMNPYLAMAFMTSTMVIALPSGVKVFNWLGTLWGGSIRFDVPTMCAIAFVSMFIIGGLSGIYMAATPVDIHLHETVYIVAHFHYVVFGGSLFAVFGGIFFWFPKMFGRMMNSFWGKVHFWLTFIGFNGVFFPMHIMGAGGYLRRIGEPYRYDFLKPFQPMAQFVTYSAMLLGIAQVIFVLNFLFSIWKGRVAEANPWGANTLEWSIPSPAPEHNYEKPPVVNRGPYEFGTAAGDFLTQTQPPVPGESSGH